MTREEAELINGLCVEHGLFRLGVIDYRPTTLAHYSLAQLIEARDIVRAENRLVKPGGGRSFHTVCDDRLLAALYVAHHYDAVDPGRDIEPIVVAGDRAVVVLRMPPEVHGG